MEEVIDMNSISEQISIQQPVFQQRVAATSGKGAKRHLYSKQDIFRVEQIGAHIKALRIKKGYTSAEIFAYEHNLNRISYWRMESGNNITMTSLFRILDIHRITLSEFFKDID